MKSTTPAKRDRQQEVAATGRDTRTAILTRSIRANVPLRKTFVLANAGGNSRHGPLKDFVTGRDLRALKAYLLIVAGCSNGDNGWSTTHDSKVWARLMDIHETAEDQSARTGAWRALLRLRQRKLIECCRSGTMTTVTGLALYLVVAREKNWSTFPAAKAPEWYGWSADTHERGLKKLIDSGLSSDARTTSRPPSHRLASPKTHQYKRTAIAQPPKPRKKATAISADR